MASGSSTQKTGLQTVQASAVQPKHVEWIYPDRIPRGGLTNIVGDPGIGKGWFCVHVTSKVTSGGTLPGMPNPILAINVLILAAEDEPETVLRPRLEDMGADLGRVHIYTGYINSSGQSGQFDIGQIQDLENKIRSLQTDLVLIDPLIDFFGRANINKAQEVKALLLPLHDLAKKLNIAIVCVIHCNKADVKALYKGSGSIQFAGKARSVFLVEKSPEDEDEKVVCHVKSNLGNLRIH